MIDGAVVMEAGRLTRIDEAALLDEIATEFHGLAGRYAEAEADAAPLIAAVEAIYRRSLALQIPADTIEARLT
jgi:guanine deaminase